MRVGTRGRGDRRHHAPRLAEQLAAPHLAPRRPATRQVLSSAWRRVLHTDPGVFEETADHPAAVRALVSAHRELRDLSPDALREVAQAGAVSRDLVRLHGKVVSLLARDWYDETDLLHTATALAGQVTSQVILYLPQDLTNAEADFVQALGAAQDVVVITGRTHVERADEGVLARWAQVAGAGGRPEWGAEASGAGEGGPTVATATEVLHASDSDDEVRCVVRQVVSTLQDTPAHRVAVLYTARDPYAALLQEHLAAARIRVNGPGSRRSSTERSPARCSASSSWPTTTSPAWRGCPTTGTGSGCGTVSPPRTMSTPSSRKAAIGEAIQATGPVALVLGPAVSAFGGFVTGSGAGANSMFVAAQAAVAEGFGVSVLAFVGVQNAAAGVLTMASPARVLLAVRSVPMDAAGAGTAPLRPATVAKVTREVLLVDVVIVLTLGLWNVVLL